MPGIGPDAKIRVDGIGGHSIGQFTWTPMQEKTPRDVIGHKTAPGYTEGPYRGTWSCEDMPGTDGISAIDWDYMMRNTPEGEWTIVVKIGTITHQFFGVVVDEAEGTITASDGTVKRGPKGKFRDHVKF